MKNCLSIILLAFAPLAAQEKVVTLSAGEGMPADYLLEWERAYHPSIRALLGPPAETMEVVVRVGGGPREWFQGFWEDTKTIYLLKSPLQNGPNCVNGGVDVCTDGILYRSVVSAHLSWIVSAPPGGTPPMWVMNGFWFGTHNLSRRMTTRPSWSLSGKIWLQDLTTFSTMTNGARMLDITRRAFDWGVGRFLFMAATQSQAASRDWLKYDYLRVVAQKALEMDGGRWDASVGNWFDNVFEPTQRYPVDGGTMIQWLNGSFPNFWEIDFSQVHFGVIPEAPVCDWRWPHLILLAGRVDRAGNVTTSKTGHLRLHAKNPRIEVATEWDLSRGDLAELPGATAFGAYRVEVSGSVEGQPVSASTYQGVIPSAAEVVGDEDLEESEGLFAIVVGPDGEVVDQRPSVEGGKVIWYQNGLAFIRPNALQNPCSVKVNGQTFSLPLPWTRVVLVNALPASHPVIAAIQNAASFVTGDPLVPGAFFSVFGQRFGSFASAGPEAKFELGGAVVLVCGTPSRLVFNNGDQVNAVAPNAIDGRSECDVEVATKTPDGVRLTSAPVKVKVADQNVTPFMFSPDVLTAPRLPIFTRADYRILGPPGAVAGNPLLQAKRGEPIIIWPTGGGLTFPQLGDGQNAPGDEPLARLAKTPIITISDGKRTWQAQVLYAGRAPGYVGLDQIVVLVPADAPSGQAELWFGDDRPAESNKIYPLWIE